MNRYEIVNKVLIILLIVFAGLIVWKYKDDTNLFKVPEQIRTEQPVVKSDK